MKKILILIALVFLLSSCSFDIRSLMHQIEEISSSYEKSDFSEDSVYLDNLSVETGLMPKTGKITPLIVPIMFEDGNDTSKYSTNNISSMFFSNDLHWESLNSYYTKSSYNKLSFSGKPFEYQKLKNKKSYYLSYEKSDYYKATDIILQEVITKISSDLSIYDSNNDKIIDSVYLIYNTTNEAPFNSGFKEVNFEIGNYFIKQYVAINVSDMYTNNYLDSTLLIKNTAYMLGVADYADDDNSGSNKGLGSLDIMTDSLTDHNPYTKIMLGWTNPTVIIRDERHIALKPFNKNGDVIILNASYDEELGLYDEYFVIDFFTNTSINRITNLTKTGGGYAKAELENGNIIYKENMGVRIYYVNATKKNGKLKYNNQTTSNPLISLLDGKSFIPSVQNEYTEVLLTEGDIFDSSKLENGNIDNVYNERWLVSVESINDNECLLKITYNE